MWRAYSANNLNFLEAAVTAIPKSLWQPTNLVEQPQHLSAAVTAIPKSLWRTLEFDPVTGRVSRSHRDSEELVAKRPKLFSP